MLPTLIASPNRVIVELEGLDPYPLEGFEPLHLGRIISVGDEVSAYRCGDRVAFGKYAGLSIYGHLLLHTDEIQARITAPEENEGLPLVTAIRDVCSAALPPDVRSSWLDSLPAEILLEKAKRLEMNRSEKGAK